MSLIFFSVSISFFSFFHLGPSGDVVAQSVERATPGVFDSSCGRQLPTGWIGVSIM